MKIDFLLSVTARVKIKGARVDILLINSIVILRVNFFCHFQKFVIGIFMKSEIECFTEASTYLIQLLKSLILEASLFIVFIFFITQAVIKTHCCYKKRRCRKTKTQALTVEDVGGKNKKGTMNKHGLLKNILKNGTSEPEIQKSYNAVCYALFCNFECQETRSW